MMYLPTLPELFARPWGKTLDLEFRRMRTDSRSEEHTSELQSQSNLVCRLLLEKKKLRGYSAFEALRTYNRRPFHLDKHLTRLYRSAELIELEIPWSRESLAAIIREVIVRTTYKHAAIRILVTGGESEDSILPTRKPTLAVLITALGERDMERFAQGYRLITTRLQRTEPDAKTTNYIVAIRAWKEAARRNASDALYVDEQGHVLEATRSNFFIFRGDTLITPGAGVLKGITRNVVLDLAMERFPIEERPILLDELAPVFFF